MVAQYQRDLMLTDTLRLLGDIQSCVDVPARVQRLEEGQVGAPPAGQPLPDPGRQQEWAIGSRVKRARRQHGGDCRLLVGRRFAVDTGSHLHRGPRGVRVFRDRPQQLEGHSPRVPALRNAATAAGWAIACCQSRAAAQFACPTAWGSVLRQRASSSLARLSWPPAPAQEWPLAVSLLLDGCNKLARQELQAVGALQELAAEMGRRRASLLASLVAELEARVYRLGGAGAPLAGGAAGAAGSDAAALPAAAALDEGRLGVPRLPLPASAPSALLQRRNSSQDAEWSAAAGNLSARGLPPRPLGLPNATGGAAALARTTSWGRDAAGVAGDTLASLASLPRRATHRRAQTLGGLMPAASGLTAVDGHLVDAELPLTGGCRRRVFGQVLRRANLARHQVEVGTRLRSLPFCLALVDASGQEQSLVASRTGRCPTPTRRSAG